MAKIAPFKGINYLNLLNFIPKSIGHSLTSFMEKIPSQDNYMSYHFLLKHISRGFGYPPNQQVFRWMSPFRILMLNPQFGLMHTQAL